MASKTVNPPADDSDDLFDYNVDMQDIFRDANVSMDVPNREQPAHAKPRDKDLGLGLDEEIKVVKKRQPVPKLDDTRLNILPLTLRRVLVTDRITDCFLRQVYRSSDGLPKND